MQILRAEKKILGVKRMIYELVEKKVNKKDVFKVTIRADSNDADYITETEYYIKEDFEEYALKAVKDLRDNYGGSHELEDYPNEYDLSIPFNGWDGYCHSLEELSVEYIDKDGKIWDVKY